MARWSPKMTVGFNKITRNLLEEFNARPIVIRYGLDDIILIRSKQTLPERTICSITTAMQKYFPGNKIVVLDGDLSLDVVSKKRMRKQKGTDSNESL